MNEYSYGELIYQIKNNERFDEIVVDDYFKKHIYENAYRDESVRRLKSLSKKEYIEVVRKYVELFNGKYDEYNNEVFDDEASYLKYLKFVKWDTAIVESKHCWEIILDKLLLFKGNWPEILENLTLNDVWRKPLIDEMYWIIKLSYSEWRYWKSLNIIEIDWVTIKRIVDWSKYFI